MIVERRAYTFRPGRIAGFWEAQAQWNTPAVFGPILERNISYFSTIAGTTDQVIHLYRFDSVEHWKSSYDAYYRAQNPDYFALVRAMMLRQENALFAAPPVAGLADNWLGDATSRLPAGLPAGADPASLCIVETATDFFPGGLPVYWEAWRRHAAAGAQPTGGVRLAVVMTLIGRLHRVLRYTAFASLDEAEAQAATLGADPAWSAFVADYSGWVAGSTTRFLRPAPLPSRRSFFEPA